MAQAAGGEALGVGPSRFVGVVLERIVQVRYHDNLYQVNIFMLHVPMVVASFIQYMYIIYIYIIYILNIYTYIYI